MAQIERVGRDVHARAAVPGRAPVRWLAVNVRHGAVLRFGQPRVGFDGLERVQVPPARAVHPRDALAELCRRHAFDAVDDCVALGGGQQLSIARRVRLLKTINF